MDEISSVSSICMGVDAATGIATVLLVTLPGDSSRGGVLSSEDVTSSYTMSLVRV